MMRNPPDSLVEGALGSAQGGIDRARQDTSIAPKTHSRRLWRLLRAVGWISLIRVVVLGSVLLFGVTLMIAYSILDVVDDRPSLIDDLRAARVTANDVTAVRVLKFDPGAGWPSSKEDYAKKAQRPIDAKAQSTLIKLLKDSTTNGWISRNHPATFYYSILQIDVGDKGRYYIFCQNSLYEGKYFVALQAGAVSNMSANRAKDYENVPLADFLKKHDPWYRDANSAVIQTRPSYPDDKP